MALTAQRKYPVMRSHTFFAFIASVLLLPACDSGVSPSGDGVITGENGYFGSALAFGPDRLAVAATGRGGDEVLVFERGADGWERRARLVAPRAVQDADFGFDVEMDEDLIVVGAPVPRGDGSVYVFERSSEDAWNLLATIDTPLDLEVDAGFGAAVATHSGTIVAGAGRQVFVYERTGQTWDLAQTIRSPDEAPRYYRGFGSRLSLTEGQLFVGAAGTFSTDSTSYDGFGALFAYRRDGRTWVETGRVFGNRSGELLGTAVKAHGDVVVVGAEGYGERGGLLVVHRAADLTPIDSLMLDDAEPGERLGGFGDLAVSDGIIVAGVPFRRTARGITGAAFVFARRGDEWALTREIQRPDGAESDFFGRSVGLSGNDLVVGAPGYRDESGAVFEYRGLSD